MKIKKNRKEITSLTSIKPKSHNRAALCAPFFSLGVTPCYTYGNGR